MIIGVDHLALSNGNIEVALESLKDWGYQPKFVERSLPNDAAKQPYLARKDKTHDISFCQPQIPGTAIELTAYQGTAGLKEESPLKAVFCGKNPGSRHQAAAEANESLCAAAAEALGAKVIPVWLENFATLGYYLQDNSGGECARVRCVILSAADMQDACGLWLKLGFGLKKESPTQQWKLLEYKSHFAAWSLQMLLVQGSHRQEGVYPLDKPGFTCLALLTNNLPAECARLEATGLKPSSIFSLCPGGNPLKISLVCGNSGECIELIELAKEGAHAQK
jgi:hypothetical protein